MKRKSKPRRIAKASRPRKRIPAAIRKRNDRAINDLSIVLAGLALI